MGVRVSDAQRALLDAHAEAVLRENETRNLTRITDPGDVAVLHVADSLTALPYLALAPPGRIADLGSGGGYPGVPLAIATGRSVALVESRGGKAQFLAAVAAELGLDIEVRPVRAEELALTEPGSFAAVTARAVASLPALVELASPLLERQGVLVALKGDLADEEIVRGDRVARQVGMTRTLLDEVRLPERDDRRVIVVYTRTGESRVRLPRRPGMAQRKPLA
jgi:16S rRNA (guanine527-N7)-methyltransferase